MLNYNKLKNEFFVMAGPCIIESEENAMEIAKFLKDSCPFNLIFKASFEKANRTSKDSFRGLGIKKGLEILQKIKSKFDLPIVTDIHLPSQAKQVSQVADILQIPAFLARQSELLEAASSTNAIINIKKAQFMAPKDMIRAAEKCSPNSKILLTERGSSFGYHDLIVDFRNFIKMKKFGYPVVYDVTHSLQKPSIGKSSGGSPQYAIPMAMAALATESVSGLFIETHPNPCRALSDAATMLNFEQINELFERIQSNYKKCSNNE